MERNYKVDVSDSTMKKIKFLTGEPIRVKKLSSITGVNYHKLVDLVKRRKATQETIDAVELAEKNLRAKNASTLNKVK